MLLPGSRTSGGRSGRRREGGSAAAAATAPPLTAALRSPPAATAPNPQGLTTVLLALFAFILTAGASHSALPAALAAGPAGLAALRPCDWGALEPAVPIMFLALVYHDLVPVIVSYLGGAARSMPWRAASVAVGPRRTAQTYSTHAGCCASLVARPRLARLRRSAIVLGSLVPLTMFLSWEAVALSLLPAGLADAADSATLLQASLALGAEGGGSPGAALAAVPAVLGPADALLGGVQAAGGVPSGAAAASLDAMAAGGGFVDASVVGVPRAVDPLQIFVRRAGPLVGAVVEGFSFLAVMTSFIGTTLSLSGERLPAWRQGLRA